MTLEQKQKLLEIIKKENGINVGRLAILLKINYYKVRDELIPELIKEKKIEFVENKVRLKK